MKTYPFIEIRNKAYVVSLAIFIIFMIGTAIHGGFNLGIDFVGGTSVIVKLDKPVDAGKLAELSGVLEPVGLSQNIRTIGGGIASGEEAREISIDVRGTDWVDRMVKKFVDLRTAGGLTIDNLEKSFEEIKEAKALASLKSNFLPPVGDTMAPPLYTIENVTVSDLNGIFQSIFNENISLSVQTALSQSMTPEGGLKRFDINNVGGASNLAAELAAIKTEQFDVKIAEGIDSATGQRAWKDVDEFLKKTGLDAFDGPVLRRTLSADTAAGAARTVSVSTASAKELAQAFVPTLVERFRQNAEIVVSHRDRDLGGLYPSVEEAIKYIPESDPEMRELLAKNAHAGRFIIASSETVGAAVGTDLKWAALSAIFFSLIGLLLYIWFRFELRYAVGAIVATLHDTVLTLGLIGISGIEFNIPIVAAVLTVMGYSINDTIVVYDRIREKLGKLKTAPDPAIIDLAITQTLSRTILTAGTTIMTILMFLVFGPAVTRGLSFTLTFGIFIGTLSSIFVAAPVLVEWERLLALRGKRQAK